jgi:hypothetical protein
MKKIFFLALLLSFLVFSCSDDPKPVDLSGQLGEKCKDGGICDATLACDTNSVCISEAEACKLVTCSSNTDNLSHGTCIVEDSKVACDCESGYARSGYTGTKCEPTDICTGIICSNHGTCEDVNGTPRCNCDLGYSIDGTGENCIKNLDPCANITCGGEERGTCQSTNGILECICESGYHAQGLTCVSDSNPCEGVDCSSHGNCEVDGTSASCNCDAGFVSSGLECIDEATNPCKDQTCSGFGECQIYNDEATCICNQGYIPAENLTCIENTAGPCDGVTCSNHGTCFDDNGVAGCNCDEDYEADGLECVYNVPVECQVEGMCFDGPDGTLRGRCVLDETSQPQCVCDSGYMNAGFMCIPDVNDPCYEQECSGNGTCKVGFLDVPYCDCNDGYIISGDDDLSCTLASELCAGETCSNHGTCIDNGYNGLTCDCDENFVNVGLECISNPCINNPCSSVNNTESSNTCVVHSNGDYSCSCLIGYYWDETELKCLLDEVCDNDNMHPEGNTCVCNTDYTLDTESGYCLPTSGDLCNPNPCGADSNSICFVNNIDSVASTSCICKDGYSLGSDGFCVLDVCADDPCFEDHKTVCSKDGSTFKCDCDEGYILDGDNCVLDQNLCTSVTCDATNMTGVCEIQYGEAICLCQTGYTNEDCSIHCDLCEGKANSTGNCYILDEVFYSGEACICESGYYFDYDTLNCESVL